MNNIKQLIIIGFSGGALLTAGPLGRQPSFAADQATAERKADQKALEKTNQQIKKEGESLTKQGEKQKKTGEKIKKAGTKEQADAKKDQSKSSDLNNKANRLRSQANDEDQKGHHDKAAKLRSEANDLAARAVSENNNAVGKGQLGAQREKTGAAIEQKGQQTIQTGETQKSQAK